MIARDPAPPPAAAAMPSQPLEFPVDVPFVRALGMELWRFDSGVAEVRLALTADQLNSFGVAHGGVVMTLLDVAMAHAARSLRRDDPHAQGLATIEMKTSFLRPARGRLVAVGRLLHGTVGLAFCEAEVRDDAGHVCAHATGTFKHVRALLPRAAHANRETP